MKKFLSTLAITLISLSAGHTIALAAQPADGEERIIVRFKDGVPHMSIYDGRDRSLAWQVLQVLRDFNWGISIELTPVLILEKKKEYESSFFLELDDIDLAFDYISERPMTRDYIKSMHDGQRLFLFRRICDAILATQTATL